MLGLHCQTGYAAEVGRGPVISKNPPRVWLHSRKNDRGGFTGTTTPGKAQSKLSCPHCSGPIINFFPSFPYFQITMDGLLEIIALERMEAMSERQRNRNILYNRRRDLLTGLSDLEVYRQTGFTRSQIGQLVDIFGPQLEPRRGSTGNPITPEQAIICFLLLAHGGNFHRINALCSGMSTSGAWSCFVKCIEAISARKKEFIFMPSRLECAIMAHENYEKYGIRNVALSVDGKLFTMSKRPRESEVGDNVPTEQVEEDEVENNVARRPTAKDYYSYKRSYGLNAMIVGDRYMIREVQADPPGTFHDARNFFESKFKQLWEMAEYRPYICLGDSAYTPSPSVVTPYKDRQIHTQAGISQEKITSFHKALAAVRTDQTESMFGQLTMIFPGLRDLKSYKIKYHVKFIVSCCVLFNIRRHLDRIDHGYEPYTAEQVETYMKEDRANVEYFNSWMAANKAGGRHARRNDSDRETWLTREFIISTLGPQALKRN